MFLFSLSLNDGVRKKIESDISAFYLTSVIDEITTIPGKEEMMLLKDSVKMCARVKDRAPIFEKEFQVIYQFTMVIIQKEDLLQWIDAYESFF